MGSSVRLAGALAAPAQVQQDEPELGPGKAGIEGICGEHPV